MEELVTRLARSLAVTPQIRLTLFSPERFKAVHELLVYATPAAGSVAETFSDYITWIICAPAKHPAQCL